jgi:SAM-dependent methyltransferase
MAEHTKRFTGRVAEYERYRSRYPKSVIEILRARCGLSPEHLVVDVGAGTGMLAELFLQAGNRVIAVEPNAEMRAVCAGLASRFSTLSVVDATAESTQLPESCADFVSAGRAFHWFDRARAVAEFKRILKPDGWIVLVTNRRAQDESEQAREYEQILLDHGVDYEKVRGAYRSYADLEVAGTTGRFASRTIDIEMLNLEQFLGQTQSLSVTPLPGEQGYEEMLAALRAFFGQRAPEGVLGLETVCEVVGRRVGG